MGIGKSIKKSFKKATNVLSSPTRTVAAGFTGGLSELTGMGNDISNSSWSRYTDAIGYAALAAAAPAAIGEVGFGATAAGETAAAGTTATGAGIGIGAGTAAAIGAGTYLGYKQMEDANKAASAQQRAILQAQQASEQAARESEILRKQALLASQKSITARKAAAGAVVNRLKNTNVAYLGGDEEKLGG